MAAGAKMGSAAAQMAEEAGVTVAVEASGTAAAVAAAVDRVTQVGRGEKVGTGEKAAAEVAEVAATSFLPPRRVPLRRQHRLLHPLRVLTVDCSTRT